MTTNKHITVCICTYKRPVLLRQLLSILEKQETGQLFEYSIVIVDNDKSESARAIVKTHKLSAIVSISYYTEPIKNIALARNKAIEYASGDFIALIDDDEFPQDDWLLNLYKAICSYNADGVLGPVKPYYLTKPPQWVIRGKFCERKTLKTGTIFRDAKFTRTGNVLFRSKIFQGKNYRFDSKFGKTGGEDVDLFKRMIQKGFIFIWCNDASVYEVVPPERIKRSYFLKRALLRGVANSQKLSLANFDVLKSLIAIIAYTFILSVIWIWRHDLFMKYLIKICDHLGKVLGVCGIKVIKERDF